MGGILRDIFTMGARPIALLNALRFGPLEDPANVGLMEGVVAGIAHYGNCVGVPRWVARWLLIPPIRHPFVNAMALGLMETEEIVQIRCDRRRQSCGVRGQHHRSGRHGGSQLCQC